MSASVEARLEAEAIRLYRRYAVEIVEALGFCPYAERCRLDGRTREVVILDEAPSDHRVLDRIEEVAADLEVEIGLVLLPRVMVTRQELGRWVEGLRKAHAARHGRKPILAIEGFHPDAGADTSSAERLTPFVRRTPDPTLQLTRLAVLERIRRGSPSGTAFFDPSVMNVDELLASPPKPALHERIADQNLETVLSLGVPEIERRYRDILRDRDDSYAGIDPTIIRRADA